MDDLLKYRDSISEALPEGVRSFLDAGGWWLVLIALMLFAVVLVLGYIVAGLRLGRWVLAWIGQRQAHLALALLVGLALLTLLSLVPFVGFVIALLAVLFGMGALVWAASRSRWTRSRVCVGSGRSSWGRTAFVSSR